MPFWGGMGSGAAAGSAVPGFGTAAGALIGGLGGAIKGWLGNRSANAKAKADTANANAMNKFRVGNKQGQLTRRSSLIGSALRKLAEHPEVYGKFISPDMFGYLPGPLTQKDLTLDQAPELKAGTSSGLGALFGGAVQGVGDYFSQKPQLPVDE